MACQRFLKLFFLPLILLLLPSSATSQSSSDVTLGSSLVAGGNKSWVSPSAHFAFGFYSLGADDDAFLLAIWYNLVPEKTVVWTANGNNPVGEGSRVDLTSDGSLQLLDNNQVTWSANATDALYGAMLDTGDFILVGANSQFYIWQSFQHPTDTFLPSQELFNADNYNLTSRQTKSNYTNGRFALTVEPDGNLLLWTLNLETRSALLDDFYWDSGTHTNSSRLVFKTSTGSMYFLAPNGTRLLSLTTGKVPSTKEYYHRATLDYDGVLRHYIHPKNNSNATRLWSLISHTPANICMGRPISSGRGVCGFNTICRVKDNRTSQYSCDCVDGYSPVDVNETSEGCKRVVIGEICGSGGEEEAQWQSSTSFKIKKVIDVDWPKSDYDQLEPIDEEGCRRSCEDDCLCDAAVFYGPLNGCYKKSRPLANGRVNSNRSTTAFIRIWNSRLDKSVSMPWKSKYKSLVIGSSTALGASVLLNILFLLSICPTVVDGFLFKSKKRKRSKLVLKLDPNEVGFNRLHCFSCEALEESTNGFKEQLGHGCFGTVYKGVVNYNHQTEISIAVKRLDNVQIRKGEKECRTEVNVIGQTHHRNLVNLLGYCNEGDNRILVYEFMSNGSLASLLFGVKKPSWSQRFRIMVSVAKGLAYLHEECNNPIIHCDIKSQNVLLDDNLEAKISDFGLAKLMNKDQSRTNTNIRGTRGYVAPEWFRKGAVTAKVDVYSFGVMLLEIIYCRKSFEPDLEEEGAAILVDWAYDCNLKGNLLNALGFYDDGEKEEEEEAIPMHDEKKKMVVVVAADSQQVKEEDEETIDLDIERIEKMLMIGIWCVQEDDSMRPTMGRVVLMLEGTVEVAPPPDPYCDSEINYIHDEQEIQEC